MCCPSQRLGLVSLCHPLLYVIYSGGFQDSCPCSRTQPTTGYSSNTQSAAQPQAPFLCIAFYITLSSLFFTMSLSHNQSSYIKTVYFLSLGVHPTSTLAEMEGWGCSVWKIALLMLAYAYQTKILFTLQQQIGFANAKRQH